MSRKLFGYRSLGRQLKAGAGVLFNSAPIYESIEPPTIPQNIVISNITDTGFKITNDDSGSTAEGGIKGYRYWLKVGTFYVLLKDVLAADRPATITQAEPGATLEIVASAYDFNNNNSEYSDVVEVQLTDTDTTAPTISSIKASSPAVEALTFTIDEWLDSDDKTGIGGRIYKMVTHGAGEPSAPSNSDPDWSSSKPTVGTFTAAEDQDFYGASRDKAPTPNISDWYGPIALSYTAIGVGEGAGFEFVDPDNGTGFEFVDPNTGVPASNLVAMVIDSIDIIGPTQLRIRFTNPAGVNGYLYYTLYYSTNGSDYSAYASTIPIGTAGSAGSFLITGLTEGTDYWFKSTSFNGTESSDSNVKTATTPAGVSYTPTPPDNLVLSATDSYHLALTFDEPVTTDATQWEIVRVSGGSASTIAYVAVGSQDFANVPYAISASPSTTYFVFVRGVAPDNSKLDSVNSNTAQTPAVSGTGYTYIANFDSGVVAGNDGYIEAFSESSASTTQKKNGNYSCKWNYLASQGSNPQVGGNIHLSQPFTDGMEIWWRLYHYVPSGFDFTNDAEGIKFMRFGSSAGSFNIYPNWGGYQLSTSYWSGGVQNTFYSTYPLAARKVGTIKYNQWTCIEMYLKLSSSSDGKWRAWQDGSLVFESINMQTISTLYPIIEAFMGDYWNGGVPQNQVWYVDAMEITNVRPSQQDTNLNYMIGTL